MTNFENGSENTRVVGPESMLTSLFGHSDAVKRHLRAPELQKRELYLTHLAAKGLSKRFISETASLLLHVVRILGRRSRYDENDISQAAAIWDAEANVPRSKRVSRFKAVARSWCRFSGCYTSRAAQEDSRLGELNNFVFYLKKESGYLPTSVRSCTASARLFLQSLRKRKKRLPSLKLKDVEHFLEEGRRGGWRFRTSTGHVHALRVFFKFLEERGLSSGQLSTSVASLRQRTPVQPASAPPWEQVRAMLNSLNCSRPSQCRAKAILLLASIYGLRHSEIVRLRLDDLDFTNEVITIQRSKRGPLQQFPLQEEVGRALTAYLERVRPATTCRQVFLTLHAPVRPAENLGPAMRKVMVAHGGFDKPWGLHALRHACATELLRTGTSLRGIADFLGHRCRRSVSVYAHSDMSALRRVADFDLAGVL